MTQAIHQSLGINTADSSNQQSLMASNPNEKFVPLYEENTVTSTPSSPKVRSDLPPRDNSPIVSYIGKDELIDSMADGTGAFAAKPQFSNVRPTGAPVGAGISLIMPSNIPEEHGLPSFYGSPDRVHGDSILVSTSPRGQQSSRLDIHSTNYSSGNSSTGRRDLPGVLRSILKKENIDYENDFYWLTKFQHEKKRNPAALERSLLASSRLDFSPTLSGFPMFDLRNSSSSIAEPSQINPAFALDHSAAQRPDGVPNSYSPELPFVSNVQTSMHTNDTDDGNSLGKDINV